MTVTLSMDQRAISVPEGTTLLEAAKAVGLEIPTICFHIATTSNSLCRLCVVEVEGQRLLQPACSVFATEGMKVQTRSARVIRARRTILEMLASSVDLSQAPEIQTFISEYAVDINRFPGSSQRTSAILDDNPMFIRDYSKCILCWRCVQVCSDDAQYINAINFKGRGFSTQISTFYNEQMPSTTCVFCGQCLGVCPTGALRSRREFLLDKDFTPDQISTENKNQRKRRSEFRREEQQDEYS